MPGISNKMTTPGKKREAAGGEGAGTAKKAKSFSIDDLMSDIDKNVDELAAGKYVWNYDTQKKIKNK